VLGERGYYRERGVGDLLGERGVTGRGSVGGEGY
jgi:hypothetical protein